MRKILGKGPTINAVITETAEKEEVAEAPAPTSEDRMCAKIDELVAAARAASPTVPFVWEGNTLNLGPAEGSYVMHRARGAGTMSRVWHATVLRSDARIVGAFRNAASGGCSCRGLAQLRM